MRIACMAGGSQGLWIMRKRLTVGSFAANPFGLHDVHGNVWEWVEDCWNGRYAGVPSGGSAWERGDCSNRVLRGGSWDFGPWNLRSANRSRGRSGNRLDFNGFRVARTLTPESLPPYLGGPGAKPPWRNFLGNMGRT